MKKYLVYVVCVLSIVLGFRVGVIKALTSLENKDKWQYVVSSGDTISLDFALNTAPSGSDIWIENGVYDYGEHKDFQIRDGATISGIVFFGSGRPTLVDTSFNLINPLKR